MLNPSEYDLVRMGFDCKSAKENCQINMELVSQRKNDSTLEDHFALAFIFRIAQKPVMQKLDVNILHLAPPFGFGKLGWECVFGRKLKVAIVQKAGRRMNTISLK